MLGSVLLLLMNVVIPAFLRAKLLRKALTKILEEKYLDVSERLFFLLRNLPSLPENERKAFLLYEANGQKVIEILKHPIKVWITKDVGRGLVWRVEWIR